MATLYIIRGCSGSGKSDLALKLASLYAPGSFAELSADSFIPRKPDGSYDYSWENLVKAHENCIRCTENSMLADMDIAVHNTFTREKEVFPYTKLAQKYGYKVVSLVVENRHGGKNVHGVPDEKVEVQARRFSLRLTSGGTRGVRNKVNDEAGNN